MIRIESILIPIDFSAVAKNAFSYGLSFALQFESRLILAHIAPYDADAHEKAKADLLDMIPPDCRDRLNFEIIVKSGDVDSELMAIAAEKEVGLVVMGTRGRSYVGRMILGSVTERMLRKVHIPILTVSHVDVARQLDDSARIPLGRILYATDLADGSEEGLSFSIRLARALDASLTVAHVFQFGDTAYYGMEAAGFSTDYASEIHSNVEERLNRMVGLVSDGSVPISTVVADGAPHETINVLAARYRADLIVMNLQTKGRLERAVLGTTAEHVIRAATVPVLSLPLPASYASRWIAA